MRKAMMMLLAASAVAAFSTSADAQRGRYPQNGPVTQEAYNRCFQLALARGQNTSVGDRWSLEQFIAACLNGKIR